MRHALSLAFFCAFAVGCAAGDDKAPAAAEAGPDVVGIDVTNDDTGSEPDSMTADAADASPTDAGDSSIDAAEVSTDAGTDAAADVAPEADVAADVAVAPWRKTIVIDGTNDFVPADEKLSSTSIGYDTYATWDADALYVGYSGPDIGTSASTTKWVFVYLDRDPGGSTGASKSEQYADQAASFPTGYGAEAYFAWRTDGAFSQAKTYGAGSWSTVATPGVTVARTGSFVEMRIPFALLGGAKPSKLGVVSFMMNEGTGQWTYAGLYSGSFTDGYYAAPATAPVKYWLEVDLASAAAPSAPGNRKP